MKLNKIKPVLVGLLQVVGVAVYCSLVALFFQLMGNSNQPEPNFLGMALILFLLVFSATVCGVLVFGYPLYLIIHQNTKKAFKILVYTIMYSIIIFFMTLFILI